MKEKINRKYQEQQLEHYSDYGIEKIMFWFKNKENDYVFTIHCPEDDDCPARYICEGIYRGTKAHIGINASYLLWKELKSQIVDLIPKKYWRDTHCINSNEDFMFDIQIHYFESDPIMTRCISTSSKNGFFASDDYFNNSNKIYNLFDWFITLTIEENGYKTH